LALPSPIKIFAAIATPMTLDCGESGPSSWEFGDGLTTLPSKETIVMKPQ